LIALSWSDDERGMSRVCPRSLEIGTTKKNPLMAYFNRERNVFGFSETTSKKQRLQRVGKDDFANRDSMLRSLSLLPRPRRRLVWNCWTKGA
jgi:hypothetical protein